MRTMKRLFAFVLAISMVLSSSHIVNAEETEHEHFYNVQYVWEVEKDEYHESVQCKAVFTCTECADVQEVNCDVWEEEYNPPTCTESGNKSYAAYCMFGNQEYSAMYSVEFPPKHTYSEKSFVYKLPTLEEEGYKGRCCVECGAATDISVIPKLESDVVETGTVGNITWTFTSNGILTISGNGDMPNYCYQPDHYPPLDDELTIMSEAPWYPYQNFIGAIVVEEGITSVGNCAFFDLSHVTEVTLPDSVKIIGRHSFSYNFKLENIEIPNAVTTIGDNAFVDCYELKNVTFPDSLNSIGQLAFNSTGLKTVVLPGNVKEIGRAAFAYCSDLVSVILPNGLTRIEEAMFEGCESIENFVVPASVEFIGEGAFEGVALVHNPSAATDGSPWGAKAMHNVPPQECDICNCDHSYEVEFQWNEYMECSATIGCSKCALYREEYCEVEINDIVEATCFDTGVAQYIARLYIDDQVFSDEKEAATEQLEHDYTEESFVVKLPTTDREGSKGRYCINCNNVVDEVPIPRVESEEHVETGTIDNITWTFTSNGILTISGNGDMPNYCQHPETWQSDDEAAIMDHTPWYIYQKFITKVVVESGITSVGDGAFYSLRELVEVELSDTVSRIGKGSFAQNFKLKEIVLPDNVSVIGESAFNECFALENITLPNGLNSIGRYAFHTAGLKNVVIPNSVHTIGEGAFIQNVDLVSVVLPEGLTRIETSVFQTCDSLTNLKIPSSVTYIGQDAFYACTKLKEVEIPSEIQCIEENAFFVVPLIHNPGSYIEGSPWGAMLIHNYESDTCPECGSGETDDNHEHSYGEPEWDWSDDYWSCVARFRCVNCDDVQEVMCETWGDTIKEATCTKEGKINWYAYCDFNDTWYETCEVVTVEPYGHSYYDEWTVDVLPTREKEGIKSRHCYGFDSETQEKCPEKTDIIIMPKLESEIAANGEYEGMTWSIDETGELTLSGEGRMPEFKYIMVEEYDEPNYVPWHNYRYVIKETVIEDGLTTISDHVFSEHEAMERIRIPKDVTYIGKNAFQECTSLENVNIPSSVTEIGESAFEQVPMIHYAGEAEGMPWGAMNGHPYPVDNCLYCKTGEYAHKHEYESTFSWSEDGTVCYVNLSCTTCDFRTALKCDITSEVTDPTCEDEGKTLYTASLEVEGKLYTDTKEIFVPALGHAYDEVTGKPVFTWTAEDCCTASYECANCRETVEVDCEVVSTRIEPTCVADGKEIKVAVISLNGRSYTNTVITDKTALGHQFEEPEFEWADPHVMCIAHFRCSNCEEAITKECSRTVEIEGKCPTIYTFTATVEMEGKTYTNVEVVEEMDHDYGIWHIEVYPTTTEYGSIYRKCINCDYKDYDIVEKLGELSFAGASLTLHDNLSIKYLVKANQFAEGAYTDPYVMFEMNGVKTKVTEYSLKGEYLVFEFKDIAPHKMKDKIYATLHGSFYGKEYVSKSVEYSVAQYCYNMLEENYEYEYSPTDYKTKIVTLLVNLLIYGAKSQIYMDYKTDDLADAEISEAQRVLAMPDRELVSVLDRNHTVVTDATAKWKGASLNLKDSITMKFILDVEELDGVSVKISSEAGTWTITSDEFVESTYGYEVLFNKLNAAQLSVPVYVTAYKDDVAISNTVCYSVESYASSKMNDGNTKLAELVKSMMKYGDAAREYAY